MGSGVRYGTPCWIDREGRPQGRPRLRGRVECDVAIVGGGLAGCATAFVFAQAGVKTALLEADRLASRGTAEAPGLIDAGAGARFEDLRERHGLRVGRHLRDASRMAALDLQALVRRLRIRCDLERFSVTDVALSSSDAEALEREYRALNEAGFEAVLLTGKRARAATGLDAVAALKQADAATADPFRLAHGLAKHAEAKGAQVFESTPVTRIKPGRRQVEITTAAGAVSAATVVVATDRPRPGFRALDRHLRGVATTVAVVPDLSAPLRRELAPSGAVVRDLGLRAWRVTSEHELLLWQTGQAEVPPRQMDTATVQRAGQLMYELSVLHPGISGIRPRAAWVSSAFRSHDGLVIAGPHRAFPRHLFAVGLGQDGLQAALLAARVNLRFFREAPDKGDEFWGFLR